MSEFLKVSKDQFDTYPGRKSSSGHGQEMSYAVSMGESRPISDDARLIADRLGALFDELGLSEKLAAGGITASVAIERISSGMVAAIDESLPQYAREAVLSFAREVKRHATASNDWAIGAGSAHETLRARREAEEPSVGPSV